MFERLFLSVFQYLISAHEHLSEPEGRKKGAMRSFKGRSGECTKQQGGGSSGLVTVKGFDSLGFDKTTTAVSVRQCEREQYTPHRMREEIREGEQNQIREEGKWGKKKSGAINGRGQHR
jgi:hypothetical protein